MDKYRILQKQCQHWGNLSYFTMSKVCRNVSIFCIHDDFVQSLSKGSMLFSFFRYGRSYPQNPLEKKLVTYVYSILTTNCGLWKRAAGADPEILKGGAQNSRVPNYRVPALTPFWISCSCLPLKVCPPFWSTTLHRTILRYSQNEAIFIILIKTKIFEMLHNV